MIHPLLKLVATHPELITDHAQAYAELVGDELGRSLVQWRDRALYLSLAGGLAMVGIALACVALLLWAALPPDQLADGAAPWLLVALPALVLAVAVGCWLRSRRPLDKPFDVLGQQVKADLSLLREVSHA